MTVPAGKHEASALAVCALAHACVTCAYALTRLYTFKASLMDIGTFGQVLWNVIHHGTPLSTTNFPFLAQNWLGWHFSPILLLLAPVYALWPQVEMLQIVQSLCFGFAGMCVFHALKAAGARSQEAWIGAGLYGLNPFVMGAAIWDFHEIAFSTLFIAMALWALCAHRFRAMLLALALLLLTKEHYGLSVAGFGFLWGWRYNEWRRGACVTAAGFLALFLVLAVIMPLLHGGVHPMLQGGGMQLSRYTWLALPLKDLLPEFQRMMLVQGASNVAGWTYLLLLLLSGLMLPLLAPVWLAPGVADLAANLLSNNPMPRHIAAYHSAALIPVIVVAAYQGYVRITGPYPQARTLLAALIVVSPAVTMSALPFAFWDLAWPTLSYDRATMGAIRSRLPAGAISAQPNVGMFFSGREEIYPFPYETGHSQAVVLCLRYPYADARYDHFGNPYNAPGTLPEQIRGYVKQVRALMADKAWHVAYWQPPWLVMRRGSATRDEDTERDAIARQLAEVEKNTAPSPSASP